MLRDAAKVGLTSLLFGALVLAKPTISYAPPAASEIQDETTPLERRFSLNFTGSGVACVDNAVDDRTDCTISGGGASPLTTKGDLYTRDSSTDTRLGVGADGLCLKANSATATGLEWTTCGGSSSYTTRLELGVNGAGVPITTGAKGRKTFSIAGTIQRWRLVSDVSTTTTLDIWKANGAIPTNANSITASAKPSLSAAELGTSATLTGWTTAVAAGDVFILEVESNSAAQYLALELEISVP